MRRILGNIAQQVAVSTSRIINYDVIIMDEDSMIIGSSDLSRLGDLHEASIQIMETGNPNPSSVNIELLKGTKPGYALPLELFDKKIGSFGITGRRQEVKGYCYLLKEYIETVLYQEMDVRSQMLREQAVENLLQEIATFDTAKQNEKYILMRGQELGYDLQIPRVVIVVEPEELHKADMSYSITNEEKVKRLSFKRELTQMMKNIFNHTKDIILPFQEDKFIIMPAFHHEKVNEMTSIKEKCTLVKQLFNEKELSVMIGIGAIGEDIVGIHESYHAAWRALEIGKAMNQSSSDIYYIYDLLIEDISSYAMNSVSFSYIMEQISTLERQRDADELKQTVCAWCESGFNKQNAAKILFIHRNTLQYRLSKIHRKLGIDAMDFKKIIILYLGIMMGNLKEGENK